MNNKIGPDELHYGQQLTVLKFKLLEYTMLLLIYVQTAVFGISSRLAELPVKATNIRSRNLFLYDLEFFPVHGMYPTKRSLKKCRVHICFYSCFLDPMHLLF